jgi:hypothetical protein
VDDKFFQHKDGMAMGSALSPVVSNIFMEYLALESANHKPSFWLRHVDDTFVIWPRGPQEFFDHINSVRPFIQFTMKIEANNRIHFLDVLFI